MPFQSAKQRGYLLAHPEITDKKGRSVGRKWLKEHGSKVKKSKSVASSWLKPVAVGVGTGTVGGALANQFPSYEQRQRSKAAKAAKRSTSKRGLAKRLEAPVWPDDGFFNAKAAQQAYDLVMKMDADSAEMFVTCVVSDALEADIEANRRTLQKHLDEVVAKRFIDLKRATMRVVAKGGDADGQVEFAQAVALMEEICKVKSPYDYGYVFQESNIRRDPGSGQFQTKIKRTQARPINDKTASSMGIPAHPGQSAKKNSFSPEQKAQYQDEYRQLAQFLGTVHQSSQNPGDTRVHLHFEDQHGNQWVEQANTTRPDAKMLDPRDRNLKGISAYPETLNLGGAAFGLAGAMGGGMSALRTAQVNAGAQAMPGFAEEWTKPYSAADTNARLYGRTAAGGKLLTQVAPAGSKANLAGHFGQFVGQYGPQAEAVIGPPARKTAYRYRGTEKKPAPEMVEAYRQEVNRQMALRPGFGDEETHKTVKTAQTRALKLEQGKIAEEKGIPIEAVRIPEDRRAEILNETKQKIVGDTRRPTKPTWQEQNVAGAAIMDYLQKPTKEGGAAPERGLYNLQLASGNTPPSEGVILDKDGQIVSQAIGYGDDHYLPFNLKNLKGLKGGSYIRNRSVGGLTSEDIYTGLVSGARRVTVVSRSGTFTMEFEPDFRGGRRHNDKAGRMTRRYEQLLDAVQSEQVEAAGIDPEMKRVITQRVQNEANQLGRGIMSSADIRAEIGRRVEDYKSSPDLDPETQQNIDLIVNNRTSGMTSPNAKMIRAQVLKDVARDKEYRYRLNGNGYAAALEGLREQFPYYIKVTANPTKETEEEGGFESERDQGYVAPGKIRPSAAAAGLFGVKNISQHAGQGGKISAAEADYASPWRRAATQAPKAPEGGETPAAEGAETPKAEGGEKTPAAPDTKAQIGYADKAVPLQQAIKTDLDFAPGSAIPAWRAMDAADFRTHLENKDNLTAFDNWVVQHPQIWQVAGIKAHRGGYEQAAGRMGQKMFEPAMNQQWGTKPYQFEGKAYQTGASDKDRYAEIKAIGAQMPGVVNLKPLDQMSDSELQQEVNAVAGIRTEMSNVEGSPDFEDKKRIFSGVNSTSPSLPSVFKDEKSMDAYLEKVHRTRAVNQGIPDDQRGWKEVIHNPITEEKNTDKPTVGKFDRIQYLAEKVQAQHAPGSEEHKQLGALRTDLGLMEGDNSPEDLIAMPDAHPEAFDLIMGALHSGKVVDYQPAPKPKGELKRLPPASGPIIV